MSNFNRNLPILKEWCKQDKRRYGGGPNKKRKAKKSWNKMPDEQKKSFIKGILSNKEKAAHFRTLTQEVVKEENLDDQKPAAVPTYNGNPPHNPSYYNHYGPPPPPPPPPSPAGGGPDSNMTLLPAIPVLRYVSDSGGSLQFWHVFGMMQRPDLSEIMELGHD